MTIQEKETRLAENAELLKQAEAKKQDLMVRMMEAASDEDMDLLGNLNKVIEELQAIADKLKDEEPAAEPAPETKAEAIVAIKQETKNMDRFSESARAWGNQLREAIGGRGSYPALIPSEIAREIHMKINEYGKLVALTDFRTVGGTYELAVEGSDVTVSYVAENAAITDSSDPGLNVVTLKAYKLAAIVKMSEETVEDLAVDFLDYVIEKIAKGIAKTLDTEILTGTGSTNSHITGILTALKAETNTPQIVTDSTALGAFTWANLKKAMVKVGAYREGGVLIMTQAAADHIHEFKDNSQYIFDQNKPLEAVWGMPVIITPLAEAYGTDEKCPVVVANMKEYALAFRKEISTKILDQTYAANGQIGVRTECRVDGNVKHTGAFAALKCDF